MKKILGISLIALFAAMPVIARAEVTSPEPAHADSPTVAANNPGFALMPGGQHDGNAASAGYVKGAYNAAIKAINTVNSKVDTVSNDLNAEGTGIKARLTEVESAASAAGLAASAAQQTANAAVSAASAAQQSANTALTAIGDSTTGLIHDVIAAQSTADSAVSAASAAQQSANSALTAIGDSQSGLIHDVIAAQSTADSAVSAAASAQSTADSAMAKFDSYTTTTDLQTNYAKKAGVVETIKATEIAVSNTMALANGTVTGSAFVPIMNDWANPDTVSSSPLLVDTSLLAVSTALTGTVSAEIVDSKVSYKEPTNP